MNPFLLKRERLWAFLVALLVAGCVTGRQPVDDPVPTPLRGVDFDGDRAGASDSATIDGSITIWNRRSSPVTLTFPDPCVALLRAYEADGGRLAPVWDQRSVVDCDGAPVAMELNPGESRSVAVPTVSATSILGDSLSAGRYRLTAYARPDGRIIEMEIAEADLSSR